MQYDVLNAQEAGRIQPLYTLKVKRIVYCDAELLNYKYCSTQALLVDNDFIRLLYKAVKIINTI